MWWMQHRVLCGYVMEVDDRSAQESLYYVSLRSRSRSTRAISLRVRELSFANTENVRAYAEPEQTVVALYYVAEESHCLS